MSLFRSAASFLESLLTVHFQVLLHNGSMPYNNISLHCRAGYLYVILECGCIFCRKVSRLLPFRSFKTIDYSILPFYKFLENQ
jgi:hypothetical protein